MRNRLLRILAAVSALLLVPLIAMQFTDEVNWNAADFLVMGLLLTGTALVTTVIAERLKQSRHKLMLSLFALAVVLVIWAELAVGIFGSPLAGS